MMLIDATDLILGRVAAAAAKAALLGEKINIVNCEKAVISGRKRALIEHFKWRRQLGFNPYKGPFVPKSPDRIVKRAIRGMLPWKRWKGRQAYKRIRCYIGLPARFEGIEAAKIAGAHVSELASGRYLTVGQLAQEIGSRW